MRPAVEFWREVNKNTPHHDQQRRQPGKIEGENHCHHAAAHVSPKHDRQPRRCGNQALTYKRRHDQARRCAALYQTRNPKASNHGSQSVIHAAFEYPAQVFAQHAQDARAHGVRSPYQQGNGSQKIQQVLHLPTLDPGQRVGLEVGKTLHRFLHAFFIAKARILDAAKRR